MKQFLLSILLLTATVHAACLKPQDQKHVSFAETSLSWLAEFLDDKIDRKACGSQCECPYQCACQIKNSAADLDDFENVDDLDVWELNVEDPHECCGCVCGCYNHAAAEQIKKLELQRKAAQQLEEKEKIEANEIADEKKDRAEAHIDAADTSAAVRIKKAEAAKAAAEKLAEEEIAEARAFAAGERTKEEEVIKLADDTEHFDKLHAEKVEHEAEMTIDDRIEKAEQQAAEKKAQEKVAYQERLRLEKIAIHSKDLADDDVRAAEAALELARAKHARATEEANAAAKAAECLKSCVSEEHCSTCNKS